MAVQNMASEGSPASDEADISNSHESVETQSEQLRKLEKQLTIQSEKEQTISVSNLVPKFVLGSLPIVAGFFPVGVKLAQEHNWCQAGFAIHRPLAFSFLLSGLCFLGLLVGAFGRGAAGKLLRRRYLLLIPGGLTAPGRIVGEAMAATLIGPVLTTVLLKTNVLHNLWMQAARLREMPQKIKCVLVLSCVLLAASTLFGKGLSLAVAAAAFSDMSFEIAAQQCAKLEQQGGQDYNLRAEEVRCMIVDVMVSALTSAVMAVVMEWSILKQGVFCGLTSYSLLGIVLLNALRNPLFQYALMNAGAMETSVVTSLDIIATYIFSLILLPSETSVQPLNVMILAALLCATVAYTLLDDFRQAARSKVAAEVRDCIRDIMKGPEP
ncbi:unnamed protein product [Symbiodinium sp. CCMP2592]|nr:unnamed protein product [Symbiodinium sp. CCMP2592]